MASDQRNRRNIGQMKIGAPMISFLSNNNENDSSSDESGYEKDSQEVSQNSVLSNNTKEVDAKWDHLNSFYCSIFTDSTEPKNYYNPEFSGDVNYEDPFKTEFQSEVEDCFQDDPFIDVQPDMHWNCCYCCQNYCNAAFSDHICEYQDVLEFIMMNPLENDIPTTYSQYITGDKCICQLTLNNAAIKTFLKDNLNYTPDPEQNKSTATSTTVEKSIINSSGKIEKKIQHVCNICDRKFVHASGLARHLSKHSAEKATAIVNEITPKKNNAYEVLIECKFCGIVFPNGILARNHLFKDHINHQNEDELGDVSDTEYDTLQSKFLTVARLRQKKEASSNVNKASISDSGFFEAEIEQPESEYLRQIIMTHVYQCEFCDLVFSNIKSLIEHESSHDPEFGFECRRCRISTNSLKQIKIHWMNECITTDEDLKSAINLPRVYYCNVCHDRLASLDELCHHRYERLHFFPRMSTDADVEYLKVNCVYCGEISADCEAAIAHYSEEHKNLIDSNDGVTNNGNNTGVSNNSHKKASSTKYRQYLCDVCGKSYTQSSHLWQHLRFHQGVKPFACKVEGCDRCFTIRPDLNDHIRKCHTGERPYHCTVCDKRFLTGSVFYQHRLIHRGERRYGCDKCTKRFYRADALKNHNRIHTGEKPYTCMYCPKAFRQRGDRDKHIKARHHVNAKEKREAMKIHDTEIQRKELEKVKAEAKNGEYLVYGEMKFPAKMFDPIMPDIDGNM